MNHVVEKKRRSLYRGCNKLLPAATKCCPAYGTIFRAWHISQKSLKNHIPSLFIQIWHTAIFPPLAPVPRVRQVWRQFLMFLLFGTISRCLCAKLCLGHGICAIVVQMGKPRSPHNTSHQKAATPAYITLIQTC